MKSALLVVDELPTGFSDKDWPDGPDGEGLSSSDSRCGNLVKLLLHPPTGYSAWAGTAFSGGKSGPAFTEELAALGTADAVALAQQRIKAAIAGCAQLTIDDQGDGPVTMLVRVMSSPAVGTAPVGLRLEPTDPKFASYEFSTVFTGIGDSVLIMGFYGAFPQEIEELVHRAAEKANRSLGVGGAASGV